MRLIFRLRCWWVVGSGLRRFTANAPVVRVCDRCLGEVTRRLSNAKEASSRPAVQSHEDLAKKLQAGDALIQL
ncbi:hypothetical protein CASFOL_012023 [Castilleja foliolosa]|uniref:Secreted protein n=1 Tax=Castilleja foliolosa TaxID=1961234 RepID=A0ABD3DP87_9LAMI